MMWADVGHIFLIFIKHTCVCLLWVVVISQIKNNNLLNYKKIYIYLNTYFI